MVLLLALHVLACICFLVKVIYSIYWSKIEDSHATSFCNVNSVYGKIGIVNFWLKVLPVNQVLISSVLQKDFILSRQVLVCQEVMCELWEWCFLDNLVEVTHPWFFLFRIFLKSFENNVCLVSSTYQSSLTSFRNTSAY